MTVYNKLKIAILTIITTPHLYAITLDPLQIQSAPGELLYAEMNFHHTNPNSKIEVGLATPEDVMMLGTSHRPPANLNFFTRRNSQGEGTIVITSSRPMIEAELNIILKIQEGSASHLKHIQQPVRSSAKAEVAKSISEKTLTPKFIVSEKDIALNLPESTRFNAATNSTQPIKQEKLLNAPFELPPTMANAAAAADATSSTPTGTTPAITALATPITQTAVNNFEATLNAFRQFEGSVAEPQATTQTAQSTTTPQQTKTTTQSVKKKTKTTQNNNGQKHIVQRQESLWSISQQIANQTQQPVAQVMKQIKAQNEHAFIDGNANRLRQGARLNFDLNAVPAQQNKKTNQLAAQKIRTPAGQTKYRLEQAEMSLVAESNQDASTGSAKKDTMQPKLSADVSLKVNSAREKTVTLQKNVTQLELALRQKEQRIQLLNARLAELQEQLRARQETKKSTH